MPSACQRGERHIVRALIAIVACVGCSAAAWGAPWLPPVRDGTWLENGIKQQQRWNTHETLSDKEQNDATLITSYICAVVDLEKELVRRAALLSGALRDGKKKKRLDPRMLEGMTQAVPILVPLLSTDFAKDSPTCDRALEMVQDYLAKYPEMLDKDADAIVEKALLAAYSRSSEP
jgi:hypothetical protein